MTDSIVDLRSDTVTRPTSGMREAMFEAEVGDDVLDHDPTTLALEEKVAALLGKERALFFPSGVQANQTALAAHGHPGSEVIHEAGAHIFNYEEGAGAALSGLQLRPVATPDGLLTPDLVREAIRPSSPYVLPTCLIALENTHNGAGGKILPLNTMREIRSVAQESGLPIHLDGARLWHACVETGSTPADYGALADTVMVCLSKGLGAPVGSLLAGSQELMNRAWRIRRRFGGGMRQSGFLAAAGIYALDHHRARLSEDHARAKELAERAREIPGIEVGAPDTNIVMLDFTDDDVSLDGVLAALASSGVLMVRFGPKRLRAVTHLDVDDVGVARASEALAEAMKGTS
ncbi:MAG: aminotransferase class I/II-fold pyridoxal phosphate-dependent enzyme [Gemmatimonadales bacterium]|nr:MAG: aminotransferase class I/II-fold pyridoxal phosphate-dependent enzyme [Gemmatimonadales bacterium]